MKLLQSLKSWQTFISSHNVEVILVDGGSIDDTVAIAARLGVKVISAAKGRPRQMNVGARAAPGEIRLLLHTDTDFALKLRDDGASDLAGATERSKTRYCSGSVLVGSDEQKSAINHDGLSYHCYISVSYQSQSL